MEAHFGSSRAVVPKRCTDLRSWKRWRSRFVVVCRRPWRLQWRRARRYFWRHSSGVVVLWRMNGAQVVGADGLSTIDANWRIVGSDPSDSDTSPPPPQIPQIPTTGVPCNFLFGLGTFSNPYRLGTVAGSVSRFSGCSGYPQGDSSKHYFSFTITQVRPARQLDPSLL